MLPDVFKNIVTPGIILINTYEYSYSHYAYTGKS